MIRIISRRIVTIAVMTAVVLSFLPLVNGQAHAAARPAAPVITYAKDVSNYDDFNIIAVKWKKAGNARKYQVAIRSENKKWVKTDTVRKSKANKKKYTKKNRYRVVAKGNKYIVYKYQHKYSITDETTKRSCRLVNGISFGGHAEVKINPNSTCTVAVRSVNGNRYSAWRTVTVKTKHIAHEYETITKKGASIETVINGDPFRISIGKQVAFPVPQPKKGVTEAKGITFIPSRIERLASYNKSGRVYDDVNVRGKTADGSDAYWRIMINKGETESISYAMEHPTFNADDSRYSFSTNAGYGPNGYRGRTTAVAVDPNVSIVWTLDGTEPVPGQADKSIDAAEYPFGQVKVEFKAYSGSIQVRGTSVQGRPSYIWPELTTAFNRCEWIRVYNGSTMVMESFMYDAYPY